MIDEEENRISRCVRLPFLFGVICILLGMAGMAMAQDIKGISPTTLQATELIDGKAVLSVQYDGMADFDKTLSIDKKTAIFNLSGGSNLINRTIKNKIDILSNAILDCDILTCDYRVSISTAEPMRLDPKDLTGGFQYGQANVEKVFFYDWNNWTEEKPTYSYSQREVIDGNGTMVNQSVQTQNGTVEVNHSEIIENEDLSSVIIWPGHPQEFVIRFRKSSPQTNVDIYDTTFGIENKEAGWWNNSWLYAVPCYINTTVQSSLTNFKAMCRFNTTNTTLWNTSTCTNVRFTESTNTTLLNYDLYNNSSQYCGNTGNNTTFWVSVNTTNSSVSNTTIWAYLGNKAVGSGENETATWADYAIVYHFDESLSTIRNVANNSTYSLTYGAANNTFSAYKYGSCLNYTNISAVTGMVQLPLYGVSATHTTQMWFIPASHAGSAPGFYGMAPSPGNQSNVFALGSGSLPNYWPYEAGNWRFGNSSVQIVWNSSTYTAASFNNATGAYAFYANKTLGAVNSSMSAWSPDGNTLLLFYGNGFSAMTGCVQDFRIRNTAMTADEVTADDAQTYSTGGVLETSAFVSVYNLTPLNNSNYDSTNSTPVTFTFNCSGSNASYSANLTLNGTVNVSSIYTTNNTITSQNVNIAENGTHTWSVACWNGTNYATSGTYTLQMNTTAPIVSINAFSPNNTAYQLGPVEANITSTSVINSSFTLYINWFKNGTNQTALATSQAVANNSLITITTPPNFSVGDNWAVAVWASDSVGTSAIQYSSNTTIKNYFSSVNFTTPALAYSGLPFNSALNLTLAGAPTASAYFVFNTSNTTGTDSGAHPIWSFTTSATAPAVATPTNFTGTWYYRATLANGSYYELTNTTNNIMVNTSGFFLCNSTVNTTTINYTIKDADTLLSLNATLKSVFTYGSGVNSITFTNNTLQICILPSDANISAAVIETLSATGYYPNTISEPVQYYWANSTNRTLYLTPTGGSTVTISVKTVTNEPFSNYTVMTYRYYPSNTSWLLSSSSVTDSTGQTVQYISPAPTLYHITVLDTHGAMVANISDPPVTFCNAVPAGDTCVYNIILGGGSPNYYGNITSVFDLGSFCSYVNATQTLTCSYAGALGSNFAINTLNLSIYNGSFQNRAAVATTQTTTIGANTTLTAVIPAGATGYFNYRFYAGYIGNGTPNYGMTGVMTLEQGVLSVSPPAKYNYGADGAFMVMLLCIGISLATYKTPSLMILICGGVVCISAVINLIVLDNVSIMAVGIISILVANWTK